MAVIYSQAAINNRLQGVITTIDAGAGNGILILLAGGTPVSSITLAKPSGTVNGGVLSFTTPLSDLAAAGTGNITGAKIVDSNNNTVVSGLTAGIPGSTADIIVSNGLSSTLITAGQIVSVLAAQITGS